MSSSALIGTATGHRQRLVFISVQVFGEITKKRQKTEEIYRLA